MFQKSRMLGLFFQEYFYAPTAPRIKMLNKTIAIERRGKKEPKIIDFDIDNVPLKNWLSILLISFYLILILQI